MMQPKATKTASTFQMECAVATDIRAPASKIWDLLTQAEKFPSWNTTVTSLEGKIAVGNQLKLRVPISERIFTPRVTELDAPRRMVWSDGFAPMFRGVRTYTLTEQANGMIGFSMREVFSGLMLPMIRRSLPDFGPPFEQFAADLKRAAEG